MRELRKLRPSTTDQHQQLPHRLLVPAPKWPLHACHYRCWSLTKQCRRMWFLRQLPSFWHKRASISHLRVLCNVTHIVQSLVHPVK